MGEICGVTAINKDSNGCYISMNDVSNFIYLFI